MTADPDTVEHNNRAAGTDVEGGYPSAARAWYAVALFYVACALSFLDRTILSFLVGPIRAEFQISDFEFSLIHGLAFVIFYSTLGIPIARLADRYNRRNIIIAGIVVWSVMTVACGLADSYWALFAARVGLGVGEAALSPAAVSLIADLFPKHRRALPISVFASGIHGGSAIAKIFGGLAVGYAMSQAVMQLPLFGELAAWQMAFIVVGLPGFVLALLLLTVREPARREQSASRQHPSFRDCLRYLGAHRAAYGSLMIGAGLSSMAASGTFAWVPALYERRYGWGAAYIGALFGIIVLVMGTGGLALGAWISGKRVQRGHPAPYASVMVVTMTAAILPAALLVAVHDPWWTLGCLALVVMCLSTPVGLAQAAIQAMTPNELRAQMIAIYLLIVALFGAAIGSASVALITDYVFRDDSAIGASIALVAASGSALSALVFIGGKRWTPRLESISPGAGGCSGRVPSTSSPSTREI